MTLRTGQILLNRYRIDDLLGRGGMADVYRAWDNRRAAFLALKLLRDELAQDPIFVRRFRREAQTLASLQHPHIVRLYGLEQDGMLAFMLLDYIEGQSLRGLIHQHPGGMPLPRLMEVMSAVCAGLQFAHNQGVTHADVKPGNILLNQQGKVFITDFGLALMVESMTMTMVGAGTPAYMAPEQIKGGAPSPLSDQYSLGIVVYEMVTGGQRPFTGEQARITGVTSEKVRWEHLNLPPLPPRRWNPNLPPAVEAVILKSLNKKPAHRFASVMEMLQNLEQATQGGRLPVAVPGQKTDHAANLAELKTKLAGAEARHNQHSQQAAAELAELQHATRGAVEGQNWDEVQRLAAQSKALETSEKNHSAAALRCARILSVLAAAEEQIDAGRWAKAETQLNELNKIGEEAQEALVLLSALLVNAKARAERSSAEAARLSAEIAAAMEQEQWTLAEEKAAQLAGLGDYGVAEAERLKSEIARNKAEAEQQAAGINHLKDLIAEAQVREDYEGAGRFLTILTSMGRRGKLEAARLEEQLARARQSAAQREQEIAKLRASVGKALAAADFAWAEAALANLEQLGEIGRSAAGELRPQVEEARQAARQIGKDGIHASPAQAIPTPSILPDKDKTSRKMDGAQPVQVKRRYLTQAFFILFIIAIPVIIFLARFTLRTVPEDDGKATASAAAWAAQQSTAPGETAQAAAPRPTMTPSLTFTPSLTPSLTPSQTPTVTSTASATPAPSIPGGMQAQFESKITPTPGAAEFSALTFSQGLDAQFRPLNASDTFQNPLEQMYASFSYKGMQPGVQWTALWYRDGKLVYYETTPWEGGVKGIGYSNWAPDPAAWLPGNYEVQLFVGTEYITSGRFTVLGEPPTPGPTLTPTVTPTPKPQKDIDGPGEAKPTKEKGNKEPTAAP